MNAQLVEIALAVAPGAHAVVRRGFDPLDQILLLLTPRRRRLACRHDLVVPENLSLLTLPPYAPELNPVENIWAYLRANKLAITVFDSYDEIVDACCNAWNFFANDPNAVASITSRSWAEVNQ